MPGKKSRCSEHVCPIQPDLPGSHYPDKRGWGWRWFVSWLSHPSSPPLIFPPGEFMESLQDPDLNVRRATLAFFNSAVHNKPSLVRDLLDDILPLLYQETKIRRDLIREVRLVKDRVGSPGSDWWGCGKDSGKLRADKHAGHETWVKSCSSACWLCDLGTLA